MKRKKKHSSGRKCFPGVDQSITRRDFLNAVLLGTGAALLELPAPLQLLAQTRLWEGYGGVGDYSESHGNTEEIVRILREMQNGRYDKSLNNMVDTGETFDLVVVGGGLSGLGAAYQFQKKARKGLKCLVLENHPVFGGNAKRNEFIVDGHKLTGPQASNSFVVVDRRDYPEYEFFRDLKIPRKFNYQTLHPEHKHLQFDRTNYGFMLWKDISPSVGFFFETGGTSLWAVDPWGKKLKDTPYSEKVKKDFLTWRDTQKNYYPRADFRQWLDAMTYKDYIEKVLGLSPEVTKFADPILASGLGLGCDAISAYGAFKIGMPGLAGFGAWRESRRLDESNWHSFPGGNDGFSRYLIKRLIPESIKGEYSFDDILNRPLNKGALDREENDIRIRLRAMAVRVEHPSSPEQSDHVSVTYVKNGKLFRLKARSVVMATAGWTNRQVIKGLPDEYKKAYEHFHYSPVLVVNVALTNWRFMYKLGLTGCRWFKGFGFSCNIRRPMIAGNYSQPLHPDKPAVLTFYVPLHYPGLPIHEQGAKGRSEILSTSFNEYERQIREHMHRVFGGSGFDHQRDIAGIILNRWVNAYVNPQPGFFFGTNRRPAPYGVLYKRFGRIAFGHSEFNGHQHWIGAVEEGRSAADKVMQIL
jgi:spermidine dehydrogenase